jgi:hypothetical protein
VWFVQSLTGKNLFRLQSPWEVRGIPDPFILFLKLCSRRRSARAKPRA